MYDQILEKANKEDDIHLRKGLLAALIHASSEDQIKKMWSLVQDTQSLVRFFLSFIIRVTYYVLI